MSPRAIRILGLDPGLQHTGWGLIETDGYRLRFVAEGVVSTSARDALGDRLLILHQGLAETFANFQPDEAAVENTYVARNPESALKLCQARGVGMIEPGRAVGKLRGVFTPPIKRHGLGQADKPRKLMTPLCSRWLGHFGDSRGEFFGMTPEQNCGRLFFETFNGTPKSNSWLCIF